MPFVPNRISILDLDVVEERGQFQFCGDKNVTLSLTYKQNTVPAATAFPRPGFPGPSLCRQGTAAGVAIRQDELLGLMGDVTVFLGNKELSPKISTGMQ